MTLLSDLQSATEGSAELSARAWTALTGRPYGRLGNHPWARWYNGEWAAGGCAPCITTSLDAAWRLAEERGYTGIQVERPAGDTIYYAEAGHDAEGFYGRGHTPALALVAALVAAEGK